MRFSVLTAVFFAVVPAAAQEARGFWNLDVHRVAPSLSGTYNGTQDGKAVNFDIQNDLALTKDTTPLGASLEYQGPRFALAVSYDAQNYVGANVIQRDVTISGQTYHAQATVDTRLKVTNFSGLWTVRFMRTPGFWIGLDLGVRGTALQLDATGSEYLASNTLAASFKSGLPMPQVGPSAGYTGFGGRLVIRGNYHYLAYKGATYHFTEGDIRFFPLDWLGVRAFVQGESWKVPDNSLAKDLDITLDRSGAGFGLVAKF